MDLQAELSRIEQSRSTTTTSAAATGAASSRPLAQRTVGAIDVADEFASAQATEEGGLATLKARLADELTIRDGAASFLQVVDPAPALAPASPSPAAAFTAAPSHSHSSSLHSLPDTSRPLPPTPRKNPLPNTSAGSSSTLAPTANSSAEGAPSSTFNSWVNVPLPSPSPSPSSVQQPATAGPTFAPSFPDLLPDSHSHNDNEGLSSSAPTEGGVAAGERIALRRQVEGVLKAADRNIEVLRGQIERIEAASGAGGGGGGGGGGKGLGLGAIGVGVGGEGEERQLGDGSAAPGQGPGPGMGVGKPATAADRKPAQGNGGASPSKPPAPPPTSSTAAPSPAVGGEVLGPPSKVLRRRRDLAPPLATATPTPSSSGPIPDAGVVDTPTATAVEDTGESRALQQVIDQLNALPSRTAPSERVESLHNVTKALKKWKGLKEDVPMLEALRGIMPCLADDQTKEVRAMAYRLLRHLTESSTARVEELQRLNLDVYLIRSLVRDHKHELEKQQVLRLIRSVMLLPEGTTLLSTALLRTLVAIAETPEEKMRVGCMETLAELVIRDPFALVKADGMRVVITAMTEGSHEFGPILAPIFLHLLDTPGTRALLKPGLDLETVLAPFTGANPTKMSSASEERLRCSARIFVILVRSWSGLIYLCVNDKQAVRGVIGALRTSSTTVRNLLLDMIFEIFDIEPPVYYKSFLAGKRLTLFRKGHQADAMAHHLMSTKGGHETKGHGRKDSKRVEQTNLLDQYKALLLLVFTEAGLLDVLIDVAEDTENEKYQASARQSLILLGELLQLSVRVLPVSFGAQFQSLPRLFNLASSFQHQDQDLRSTATAILKSVDSLNRIRTRLDVVAPPSSKDTRARSNSIEDPLRRGQRQIEQTRIRQGMQVDDTVFRNMVVETQVLSTKEFARWKFETVSDLIEGALQNPKRLEEAMRGSKFVRRIMHFYYPFSAGQFRDVAKSKDTAKWVQLGCSLMTTLVGNPDGIRFLSEDKLLRQIADSLLPLDPLLGSDNSTSIVFSKVHLETTLSSGYFEMLGTLSKHAEGIRLLEKHKIFTLFYHLTDLRNRDDLVKLIIENLCYLHDGHSRIILSKCLCSPFKSVRLFATERLGLLIRDAAHTAAGGHEWIIQLLITQLYDADVEVCQLAVKILDEACESMETLEAVVELRPSLGHLGDVGAPLLIKFMSASIGVRYLHEIEFIDNELDDWYLERIHSYVVQVEVLMARALRLDGEPRSKQKDDVLGDFDGVPPPHFYGELVKTEEGCEILEDKAHFTQFADFVRENGLENDDPEILAHLKSRLWAIGHVGSTDNGVRFLEAEDIVPHIIEIAEKSDVFSLRGTAFYVLGLIATSRLGVELLEDHGWECFLSPVGQPHGLAVPMELDRLVSILPWIPIPLEDLCPRLATPRPPPSAIEREVFVALTNLSNGILANKASRTLQRIKARHRTVFSSPAMYARALQLLGEAHYRLPVRRYVAELFDVTLDGEGNMAAELVRLQGALVLEAEEHIRASGAEQDGGGWLAPPRPKNAASGSSDGQLRGNGHASAVESAVTGETATDSEDDDDEYNAEESLDAPLKLDPVVQLRGFLLGPTAGLL